jgi:hypothetical protein
MQVGATPAATGAGFGYGFNVSDWDFTRLQSMGFNWMKVFNAPTVRLPVNIFIRIEANAGHLGNLAAFGSSVSQLAQNYKDYIEAYEIGNEPNLDASYGWGAAPNAADYKTVLCEAYSKIKAADPDAIVVSAGLAPTGRVQGNWNGHPGHNELYQDEREFFKEFVTAGGGNCLDAVGYHNYGFSADFDAAPDVPSGDPTQNCTNGFCFRGVEKIHELMQARGLGHKKVWTTEFGWIVYPPQYCEGWGSWPSRLWQRVTEAKQASNLVGSFEYATTNWPWMEAMFIFNLNFNTTSPWLHECDPMRWYSVQGRLAESALSSMPKVVDAGELEVSQSTVAAMIKPADQPFAMTTDISLSNTGSQTFAYTITVGTGSLTPIVTGTSGTLDPSDSDLTQVTISSSGRPTGTYTATLVITATPGTIGPPVTIPVSLFIVDEIYSSYLVVIMKED